MDTAKHLLGEEVAVEATRTKGCLACVILWRGREKVTASTPSTPSNAVVFNRIAGSKGVINGK